MSSSESLGTEDMWTELRRETPRRYRGESFEARSRVEWRLYSPDPLRVGWGLKSRCICSGIRPIDESAKTSCPSLVSPLPIRVPGCVPLWVSPCPCSDSLPKRRHSTSDLLYQTYFMDICPPRSTSNPCLRSVDRGGDSGGFDVGVVSWSPSRLSRRVGG